MNPSTWLITGASRGLGLELVEQLLARGDRVVATVRDPARLMNLQEQHPDSLRLKRLDVADPEAMSAVVAEAFADFGRVDVAVSNAGYGLYGSAEDLSEEQVRQIIDTNLLGSIRFARAVIPHLRAQGGGRIVQMSSMGAHIGFPAFSMYHASKWGIEGFFEAVAQEIAPFNIQTILVEPGMVRTSFYEATTRVPISNPYRGGPADRQPLPLEQMPGDQARVMKAVIEAASSANPPRRLLLGSDAFRLVTEALESRLAEFRQQEHSAAQTDYPA